MNINDFYTEWDGLTGKRKAEGLSNLFQILISNMGNHEDLIGTILEACANAEDYDEFGTEGANI